MDTVVRDASAALANAPTPRHYCRCRDLGVIAGLVLAAAPHDDANEHDVSSARAAAPTKPSFAVIDLVAATARRMGTVVASAR